MFSRVPSCDWLGNATSPDAAVLAEQDARDRHMWCTAGFFHLAGYAVSPDGQVSSLDKADDTGVCAFQPVQITCSDAGVTQWRRDPGSKTRFILHVRDRERYASAMTKAMGMLLTASQD